MKKRGAQIFLILLAVSLLWKSQHFKLLFGNTPLPDADAYYLLAQAIQDHHNPYQVTSMETMGPPVVILPYLALGWLPLPLFRTSITIISLAAGFISCWWIGSFLVSKHKLTTALLLFNLLLITFPFRFTLSMGQLNIVIMMFFSYFFTHKKLLRSSALTLALSSILKTQNALMLFSLVKKKKLFTYVVAQTLIILAISLWWIRPQYYQDFFNQKFLPVMSPATLSVTDYYNQSLRSVMSRIHLEAIYQPLYFLLLLSAAIYLILSENFLAGIVAAQLLSPVCWQHYFVVLFPIYVIMAKHLIKKPKKLGLLFLSFGLTMSEFPYLHQAPLSFITGMLSSHYFWGGCILLWLVIEQQKEIKSLYR